MRVPDALPPYDDAHRSLWVAVDAPAGTSAAAVVAALRDAAETVVLPYLAAPAVAPETLVVGLGADLARIRPVPGLAWDTVLANEPVESVHATGVSRDATTPAEHGGRVYKLDAELTRPVVRPDGSRSSRHVTVGFSVVSGALRAGAAAAAADWLARTVGVLDALTGFGTVDFVDTFASGQSPYELATIVVPNAVDPATRVRGYQWLTLLGPGHVEALGGEGALARAPVADVRPLAGNRYLLLLAPDPSAVTDEALRALAGFLAPVLPEGFATVAEHGGVPPFRL